MIQPGERYRRYALTPYDNDVGSGAGWWHGQECAQCSDQCGRPLPTHAA